MLLRILLTAAAVFPILLWRDDILLVFAGSVTVQPGYLDFDNLPETNFSCEGKVIGGYYADVETGCQMFHVCTIGQKSEITDIKFLCLNGTVFDQETRVCERLDEVDCSKSESFFDLNLELYGNNGAGYGIQAEDTFENESPVCGGEEEENEQCEKSKEKLPSSEKGKLPDSPATTVEDIEYEDENPTNSPVSSTTTSTAKPTQVTTTKKAFATPSQPPIVFSTPSIDTVAQLIALHEAFQDSLRNQEFSTSNPKQISTTTSKITSQKHAISQQNTNFGDLSNLFADLDGKNRFSNLANPNKTVKTHPSKPHAELQPPAASIKPFQNVPNQPNLERKKPTNENSPSSLTYLPSPSSSTTPQPPAPKSKKNPQSTRAEIQNRPQNVLSEIQNRPQSVLPEIQNGPRNVFSEIQNRPQNVLSEIQNRPQNALSGIQNQPQSNAHPDILNHRQIVLSEIQKRPLIQNHPQSAHSTAPFHHHLIGQNRAALSTSNVDSLFTKGRPFSVREDAFLSSTEDGDTFYETDDRLGRDNNKDVAVMRELTRTPKVTTARYLLGHSPYGRVDYRNFPKSNDGLSSLSQFSTSHGDGASSSSQFSSLGSETPSGSTQFSHSSGVNPSSSSRLSPSSNGGTSASSQSSSYEPSSSSRLSPSSNGGTSSSSRLSPSSNGGTSSSSRLSTSSNGVASSSSSFSTSGSGIPSISSRLPSSGSATEPDASSKSKLLDSYAKSKNSSAPLVTVMLTTSSVTSTKGDGGRNNNRNNLDKPKTATSKVVATSTPNLVTELYYDYVTGEPIYDDEFYEDGGQSPYEESLKLGPQIRTTRHEVKLPGRPKVSRSIVIRRTFG